MGMWGEINKGIQQVGATGMGLLKEQNDERYRQAQVADSEARLQIAKDQAQIQNATHSLALEEAQKIKERNGRIVDLTVHPGFLSLPEEERPKVLKFFSDNKLTDETGKGTLENIESGAKMISGSAPLFKQFLQPVVDAAQKNVLASWNELQEATVSADPKKIAIAKQKFDQANMAYHEKLGTLSSHLKDLTDQEQAKELERIKQEGKVPEHGVTEITSPNGKTAQKMQFNPETNRYDIPVGAPYVVKSQVTNINMSGKDKEIDIPLLADSIVNGQDAPIAIKGSMGNPVATKVKSEILKKYPKFNMGMADANYKWKQSATNQRTINFAGGALPRLTSLDAQLSALPNVNLNTINKVMRAVSIETGKPEYSNYESNRNAIVQEVNTALSGSSQSSDMRVIIELENLKTARSPAQIRGAISNLREALIARMDVDLSPLYPMEVVRGEKTMEQHKKEMFAKYRGKYGVASEGQSSQAQPNSMDAFWK